MFCNNPCDLGTFGDVQQNYTAAWHSDWEVSTKSIEGQLFGQPIMAETYSQVPLQCGKLESVKTPETIC